MLNILSGQDTANVKSFPVADAVTFLRGEWATFDSAGKLVKATAFDGTKAVFPVYSSNATQYDDKYLGRVDVVTSAACVLETDVVEADTFVEGAAVTIGANGLKATGATAANRVGFVIKVLPTGVVQFVRA